MTLKLYKVRILISTLLFVFSLISLSQGNTLIAVYDPSVDGNGLVNEKYSDISSCSIDINDVRFPKVRRNDNNLYHGDKVLEILNKLVSINQCIVVGSENKDDIENLGKAIDYAHYQGAKVFLMTYNIFDNFGLFRRQFYYDIISFCNKYPEMTFIISAGNESMDLKALDEEDKQDNLVVVGSCNDKGIISTFSNRGDFVDLYTLGEIHLPTGQVLKGTSFSAPIVAAYCSYIYDNIKNISGKEVKNKILEFTNNKFMLSYELIDKITKEVQ